MYMEMYMKDQDYNTGIADGNRLPMFRLSFFLFLFKLPVVPLNVRHYG